MCNNTNIFKNLLLKKTHLDLNIISSKDKMKQTPEQNFL